MARLSGVTILAGALVLGGRLAAQEAPPADAAAATATSPGDAAAQFNQFKEQWSTFSLELDKARYKVNNCPPNQKNAAALAYETLIEQGNALLDPFIDAAIAAFEADPQNSDAEHYLHIMIEATLKNDRYEDVRRMTTTLLEHGEPNAQVCEQAAMAALELLDLDAAESLFARADELGDLSSEAQQKRDALPEWRSKLARENELRAAEASADNLPRVTIATTKGDIVIELFENQAPNTVANFITLADRKFYEDLQFYRVENNFAAIAGCPGNRGVAGPGHEIVAEIDRDDRRPAMRGSVAMVNGGRNRCGSQFFIALSSSGVRSAENSNPVFGRVVSGMEVVERLRRVNQDTTPKEFERDRILDIRVDRRQDHDYTPTTTFDVGKAKEAEALELMKADKYDEAERVLEEGLAVAPWWYNLRYRLGILKLERGEAADAIPHLSRAARMAPREPDPHRFLAIACAKAGELELAEENFEKVLKLRPTDVVALKGLGIVYFTQRRFREAMEMFERALEIDPDDREAQQYRNRTGEQLQRLQKADE